jgi:hypothetical protein
MLCARPLLTNSVAPSGESTAPIGRGGVAVMSGIVNSIALFAWRDVASATEIEAAFSHVMKSVRPSAVTAMERGRAPVGIRPTIASDRVSTTATAFSASHVT